MTDWSWENFHFDKVFNVSVEFDLYAYNSIIKQRLLGHVPCQTIFAANFSHAGKMIDALEGKQLADTISWYNDIAPYDVTGSQE